MISADFIYFASLLALTGFAQAVDSIPCISGSCSHSGGDNVNSLVHTIYINGTQELIGDVTPAAGWNIQGCDSDWSSDSHTVNMTCEGNPDQIQHCKHIFNGGVENTIVRLPENCGTGPFARIVSVNNGTDGVHMMQLDYNFAQIPTSRGNVSFQVNLGDSAPSGTSTALQPRFTKSPSKSFPIAFQKSVSLFNKSVSCEIGGTDVELDLNVDGTGAVNGSLTFVGTIIGDFFPPKITGFELTADISGTASLDLDINAGLLISTTTGDIQAASISIPELSIPGLVAMGPQFEIITRADINASLQSTATVNAQWDINNIHIVYPSTSGASSRNITLTSSDPIHMNANPSLAVGPSISITGHVIPKFSIGVTTEDDFVVGTAFAETDCFVNLSGDIELTFDKRDHTRDLFKRGIAASISVDAGVDFDIGVMGEIGPLKGGDEIVLASVNENLFKRNFPISGPPLPRRELSEVPQVFKRDDGATQCPSIGDIVPTLTKLI